MKVGNLELKWHKHNWVKKILSQYQNEFGDFTIKVGEECEEKDCNYGAYRYVYFIDCKNNPDAYKIK